MLNSGIDAKKGKVMKEELVKHIITKFSNRFHIRELSNKNLPDLILYDKHYYDPIFDMFILELEDELLDRLLDWRISIRNESINHYIILPENKIDNAKKYINLVAENIKLATYNNENIIKFYWLFQYNDI